MNGATIERSRVSPDEQFAAEIQSMIGKQKAQRVGPLKGMSRIYLLYSALANGGAGAVDRPLIGTLCAQVPVELIHAAGAVALRLCNGAQALEGGGGENIPEKSCPVVRAADGMVSCAEKIFHRPLDMIVVPTACEQKAKAAELWREAGQRIHILDLPRQKDSEAGRRYWYASVNRLAEELQKLTGRRITRRRLKNSISRFAGATQAYRRFSRLAAEAPAHISSTDKFLVAQAQFFAVPDQWAAVLAGLCEEIGAKKSAGRNRTGKKPRILLTGAPVLAPRLSLLRCLEDAGAVVLADDMCSWSRAAYDAVSYDEPNLYDMIPAVADRYLKPSICPCFSPADDRRRYLLQLVDRIHADGVIHQTYAGCHLFDLEQPLVEKSVSAESVPFLRIESGGGADSEQMATRIEAFIESIQARRGSK